MIPSRLFLNGRSVYLRRGEPSDYDSVLKFLRKNFYPYDPFGGAGPYKSQSPEDEQQEMEALAQGTSVLAVTDDVNKELIGTSLGRKFAEEIAQEKLKRLQRIRLFSSNKNKFDGIIFLNDLMLRSEVCRKFNVQEAFYLSSTGVREDFRKQHLGVIVDQRNMELARELGFNVTFSIAISHLGARHIKFLHKEMIHSVKFSEYKDFRGLNVFKEYTETFPPDATAEVWATKM